MIRSPLFAVAVVSIVTATFLFGQNGGDGAQGKAATLKHFDVDLGNGVVMKLVRIEAGKFMMGSPRDEKEREENELLHEVEITRAFFMGRFEVTQQEYEKVVGKNPSKIKGDRLPVGSVSWEDATEFCQRLSRREGKKFDLPTEAEWEYACRAGSKEPFHLGSSLSSKQANCDGRSPYGKADKGPFLVRSVKVGSHQPNAFGLHDMHGNMFEWCKDWYAADYYKKSERRDPQGPQQPKTDARHVLRGGSFLAGAMDCRSAYRFHHIPDSRGLDFGFRVVLRIP